MTFTSFLPGKRSLISQSCDIRGDGNLLQGCSFSPDGLCVLTSTAGDARLRLYNTTLTTATTAATTTTTTTTTKNDENDQIINASQVPVQEWTAALSIHAGDVVRSYAWYPLMSSHNPASSCFVACSKDQPVHLYDAYTGAIRATYRPYNALDEMESPLVLAFDGSQRLLCGGFRTDRCIHMFDLARPGRDSTILRLGKSRRSTDGQKGIVSAIATTPDRRYFAFGTYTPGSIYIYDDRAGHFANNTVLNGLCVVGHGRTHSRKKRRFVEAAEDGNPDNDDNDDPDGSFIRQAKTKWFQKKAQGGVTQLRFAPNHEYLLYSASRRSNAILTWDLRMLSDVHESSRPPIRGIGSFGTVCETNQRLEFDLSDNGDVMFVGGMDKCMRIYDTQTGKLLDKIDQLDDAVNGVSFAKLSNQATYLSVATGSRRFEEEDEEDNNGLTRQRKPPTIPGYLRLYKLLEGQNSERYEKAAEALNQQDVEPGVSKVDVA